MMSLKSMFSGIEGIYSIDPLEWPASQLGSPLTVNVSAVDKSKPQQHTTVRHVLEWHFLQWMWQIQNHD